MRIFRLLAAALVMLSLSVSGAWADAPCAGMNLIMVQLESFQAFAVGRFLPGGEITPRLNALAAEGLYFANCYPQTVKGNTSDAEFMAETSLMPAKDSAVFQHFISGQYNSLAAALKTLGYRTGVFHGNKANVWNRPAAYRSLSLERFDSRDKYASGPTIGLGLADSEFYAETARKLAQWHEPFYARVISLSSHHPFKIPPTVDSFDPSPFGGTILGDYLRAIHYADRSLGEFIDALASSGLLERSLVVIYGDHGGVPLSEQARLALLLGRDVPEQGADPAFWRGVTTVPLLFLAPKGILQGSNENPAGQIDIAPTAAGLLGMPFPALGRDLRRNDSGLVPFRDGGFIKGDFWATHAAGKLLVFDLKARARGENPVFSGEEAASLFSGQLSAVETLLRSSDQELARHEGQ